MKIAAARGLAAIVSPGEVSEEYVIPSVFDKRVAEAVAAAVARAAVETGVARRRTSGRAGGGRR
jgi:malate dehydrogenase (oxaloacetate-decarboxylating)